MNFKIKQKTNIYQKSNINNHFETYEEGTACDFQAHNHVECFQISNSPHQSSFTPPSVISQLKIHIDFQLDVLGRGSGGNLKTSN